MSHFLMTASSKTSRRSQNSLLPSITTLILPIPHTQSQTYPFHAQNLLRIQQPRALSPHLATTSSTTFHPPPSNRFHLSQNVRAIHNEASRRAQQARARPLDHSRQRRLRHNRVCKRASGRCEDIEESGGQGCIEAVLEGEIRFQSTWLLFACLAGSGDLLGLGDWRL